MAFCSNCGTQLNDDAAFCPNCGNSMQAAPAQENFDNGYAQPQNFDNGYAQPEQAQPYDNNGYAPDYQQPQYDYGFAPENQPKKDNKKIIIIAAIAAVIVAVILAIVFLGGGSGGSVNGDSPEEAVEAYVDSMLNGDLENAFANTIIGAEVSLEDYMEISLESTGQDPDEMFEQMSEYTGENISDIGDYIDYVENMIKERMSEQGDFDVSVEKGKDYSKSDLEDLREEVADRLDSMGIDNIDVDNIEEACDVEFTLSADGEEDTNELTAVKYNGEWKVLEYDVMN